MKEKNETATNYYVRGDHPTLCRVDSYHKSDIPAKEKLQTLRNMGYVNLQVFKITKTDRVEKIVWS